MVAVILACAGLTTVAAYLSSSEELSVVVSGGLHLLGFFLFFGLPVAVAAELILYFAVYQGMGVRDVFALLAIGTIGGAICFGAAWHALWGFRNFDLVSLAIGGLAGAGAVTVFYTIAPRQAPPNNAAT